MIVYPEDGFCIFQKLKFRALSKSQNWPARPWLEQHFYNEIGFSQQFLLKNHLLRAWYLGFDGSGWKILIKSKILITTGMVWPVSSDKWKAPLGNSANYLNLIKRWKVACVAGELCLWARKWAAKVRLSFPLSSSTKPPATKATERQMIRQKVKGGLTLTLKALQVFLVSSLPSSKFVAMMISIHDHASLLLFKLILIM